MAQNLVTFKGKRDGISIYIKDGSFDAIKKELERKIRKSEQFFEGAKIIEITGIEEKILKEEEVEEIKKIVTEKYSMIIIEDKKREIEKEDIIIEKEDIINIKKENIINVEKEDDMNLGYFDGLKEGNTKFITNTIRSGQLIEFNGNIVIIGDVNPGGELSAKGNIVVLGTLRGMAYAGNDGNQEAIVAAFKLNPMQLRIAHLITRKPDNDDDELNLLREPEVARIYDEAIIIESYLTKK